MKRCLDHARRGAGYVSPNPLVGAIIVRDGKIIGKGYHNCFGEAHAEVNAVNDAGGDVRGGTLYVNLEPCCYYGKTPPCTELIISSGIRRVVVGSLDRNPLVAGKGIRKLVEAGLDVSVGVLKEECDRFNEFFFKWVTTGLPFVALKIAQTLDGKIATVSGDSKWISSEESRRLVHALRSQYDAVLVGSNTVRTDDPELTVRLAKGRNPYRVLIDGHLTIPLTAKVLSDTFRDRTIVVTNRTNQKKKQRRVQELKERGIQVIQMPANPSGKLDIRAALRRLARLGITSVLVEGGGQVFTSFLRSRLVDKMLVFIAPKVIGEGIPSLGDLSIGCMKRAITFTAARFERVGSDILFEGYLPTK
jgi:diaminohydroxyphosphoribosylaminopyrimidine deaminase/5-amino-6-(5-phosphoribosylamino)uracil reductase